MSQIDILLPFGLPAPDLGKDLLRQCTSPALAMLLSRAKITKITECDPFARALPHEAWLAQHLYADVILPDNSPPIAHALMRQYGLQADGGTWFVLHPVHFHIARDHIVLTDPRQLVLDDHEARALFDVAQPLFEEEGKTLVYGDAGTWFMQADDWHALQTATPTSAYGRNIDIWQPRGTQERAWRKLQNEVQMHWHIHEVNAAREARGADMVNSLWLWGGINLSQDNQTHPDSANAASTASTANANYSDAFHLQGWSAALASIAGSKLANGQVNELISASPQHVLLMLDSLLAPALAADWGTWLQELDVLERSWFAPLLAALQEGKIKRIKLILSHGSRLIEFSVSKSALRQFWRKPSLQRLLS